MPGLSGDLYERCRSELLKCSEFNSDAGVRNVFVTQELHPFKANVPGANSKAERVAAVLGYLLEQEPDAGPPVLVLFLRALSDRYSVGNALHNKLKMCAREVAQELKGEDAEDSSPCLGVTVRLMTKVLPTAYCYQVNKETFPLISVTVNNAGSGCTNAAVRIQAVIEGFSDQTVVTSQVPQGEQAEIVLLPLLRQEEVATLNEMRPVTLHVAVEQTAPSPRLLLSLIHI